MKLHCALRVKSAEFWLKLGQPAAALLELQRLPKHAQTHPWATAVWSAVQQAVR